MSKARLTDQDFCRAADRLGCEPAAVAAVAQQESLQAGFDDQDRPTILFERHIFHRLTGGRYDESHPNISNPVAGGYGKSGAQYGRFSEAFGLNPQAAMKAASWGKFQILGKNFAVCGFASVDAFVDAMKVSESNQLDAFVAFVLHEHLDLFLTDLNWTGFANAYNGAAQKRHHYDDQIAAKYKVWKRHDFGCGKDPAAGQGETLTPAGGGEVAADPPTEQPSDDTARNSAAAPLGEQPKRSWWDRATGWQGRVDQINSWRNSLNPFTPSLSPISGASSAATWSTKIMGWVTFATGFLTHNWIYLAAGVVLVALALAYLAMAKRNAALRMAGESGQTQQQTVVVKPEGA